MTERTWTAVVAEDEPLLRQALLDALALAWPDLQVLAACEDGAAALERRHEPRGQRHRER